MKVIKDVYGTVIYENDGSRDDKDLSNLILRWAYLKDIDLRGYNFEGSNLGLANIKESNLEGSSFEKSDICGTDLTNCNLKNCNFTGCIINPYRFKGSNIQGFIYNTCEVPVIDNIHFKLYEAITKEGCSLDMSEWHSCNTTHCRAGWIVHIAGDKGYELERNLESTEVAAAFIYFRSDPNMTSCPDFYANNEDAMEDIEIMAFKGNKKIFLKSNVKKLFEYIRGCL